MAQDSTLTPARPATSVWLLDLAAIVLVSLIVAMLFLSGGVFAVTITAVVVAAVLVVWAGLSWRMNGRWLCGRLLHVRAIDQRTGYPSLSLSHLVAASTQGRDPLGFPTEPQISLTPAPAPWAQENADAITPWRLTSSQHPQVEVPVVTVIGRVPSAAENSAIAEIAIIDVARSLSRTHALIEPRHDALRVTDLGSTNGSWVVRERSVRLNANQPVDLPEGTHVRFGDVEFTVEKAELRKPW
ncbi:MAG: FHA domain-containing protein [Canibacter sp.]